VLNDIRHGGSEGEILVFTGRFGQCLKFEVSGVWTARRGFFPFDETGLAFGCRDRRDPGVPPSGDAMRGKKEHGKNRRPCFWPWVFEDRDEAFTFEGLRMCDSGQCLRVAECRVDIHGFHKRAVRVACCFVRRRATISNGMWVASS